MAKPVVSCKLVEFVEYATAGKPHVYVAHIHILSEHPRIGIRPGIVRTSTVLWIDFRKKQFETLNTDYRW